MLLVETHFNSFPQEPGSAASGSKSRNYRHRSPSVPVWATYTWHEIHRCAQSPLSRDSGRTCPPSHNKSLTRHESSMDGGKEGSREADITGGGRNVNSLKPASAGQWAQASTMMNS